jgi:hypothetical protein
VADPMIEASRLTWLPLLSKELLLELRAHWILAFISESPMSRCIAKPFNQNGIRFFDTPYYSHFSKIETLKFQTA